MSDLRESGSLEQDADLVLMLYKNNSNNYPSDPLQLTQLIELIVAKQRNGPTGTVKLKFNEGQTKFYNNDLPN